MILTCRQASAALAAGDYATLGRLRRVTLRLHVGICAICGRFNRQLMDTQDGERRFLENEDRTLVVVLPSLTADARARMKAAIGGMRGHAE